MKSYELFSEISTVLLGSGDFGVKMNTILRIVGRYTKVSRVYIFIDDPRNGTTSNEYEWCNRGIAPQISELQNVPYAAIPSWKKLLGEGMIYSVNIVELPTDVRAVLEPQGILSLVVYPLKAGGGMRGFLGFDDCRKHRTWSRLEINLLKTVADLVSAGYEQRLNHEYVETSRNNFEAFFNTIGDMLVIGDSHGRILHANRATVDKLGYSVEELTSMSLADLHPDDVRRSVLDTVATGFSGEFRHEPRNIVGKNGVTIPVETRVWTGAWNGEPCTFGLSKDLTSEQEALQKFTKLFHNNPALMAIRSLPDGVFVEVNDSFVEKLGYSREELYGRTSAELGLFVDGDLYERIFSEIRTTGRIRNIEVSVRRRNGDILFGLMSGEVVRLRGEPYLLSVMVDITAQVLLRNELQESGKRYNLALEGTAAGLWDWDMIADTVYFSPLWKKMLGYEDREIENTFDGWKKLWHPDDVERIETAVREYLEGRSPDYEIVHRLRHKSGEWRWILTRGSLLKDGSGRPYRWVGTNIDITEAKERSEELERFFSVNLDLLCIADTDGYFLKTNKAWEDILGYSAESLEGRKFLDFVHPDDLAATLEAISELGAQKKVLNFVNRYRHRDGSWRYIEWRSHPYGKYIYAAARDVTERIEWEKKLQDISIRDPLTNIYNRRHIFERLDGVVAEYRRLGKPFSVAMLDIDRFKAINDGYGHQAGDFILSAFAKKIGGNLRSYDLLGRYGGEEFIVVSPNTVKEDTATLIGRILDIVRSSEFVYNDAAIQFTFSCGIADSPEFGREAIDGERLVGRADERLYEAKRSGRNRIVVSDAVSAAGGN